MDELPQLFNIIKGDMRFIGPRPEIPQYVNPETFDFLKKIKPGLSGYSSILFRNEAEILSMIDQEDPYDDILKIKIALDKYYLDKKGFFEDLKLVFLTIFSLIIPKRTGHYILLKLLKIKDKGPFEAINKRTNDNSYASKSSIAWFLYFSQSHLKPQFLKNSKSLLSPTHRKLYPTGRLNRLENHLAS